MSHDHDQTQMNSHDSDHREPDILDRFVRHWAVTAIMIGIVIYYLVAEHAAHFFGALPWLILLACPLLHIFMHGGHGGHDSHDGHGDHNSEDEGGR